MVAPVRELTHQQMVNRVSLMRVTYANAVIVLSVFALISAGMKANIRLGTLLRHGRSGRGDTTDKRGRTS